MSLRHIFDTACTQQQWTHLRREEVLYDFIEELIRKGQISSDDFLDFINNEVAKENGGCTIDFSGCKLKDFYIEQAIRLGADEFKGRMTDAITDSTLFTNKYNGDNEAIQDVFADMKFYEIEKWLLDEKINIEDFIRGKDGRGPLATAALRRPTNFDKLSNERQWEIDKQLGILDWDGDLGK